MFGNQPLPTVICPYCKGKAELVKGEHIHGMAFKDKDFWLCRPCDAWVGVHPHSNFKPLGILANKALRKAKQEAHGAFDRVARLIMNKNCVAFDYARRLAYDILSDRMQVSRKHCHIGNFDESECGRCVEACTAYLAEHTRGNAA